MKRFFALAAALLLATSFVVGCGEKKEATPEAAPAEPAAETKTETPPAETTPPANP